MTTSNSKQPSGTKVSDIHVVLQQAHTHNREDLQPGAKLTLPKAQAEWLIKLGVAEAVT